MRYPDQPLLTITDTGSAWTRTITFPDTNKPHKDHSAPPGAPHTPTLHEMPPVSPGGEWKGVHSASNGIHAPTMVLASFFFFLLIVCFTSYFLFSIAVLPHSPGVVYYHLLLRQETRIPGVAPFSFRIGIWDLFEHRGQKSYTPTAFGKLWTTQGVRCMKHASS